MVELLQTDGAEGRYQVLGDVVSEEMFLFT
jgi:hypothetical protein